LFIGSTERLDEDFKLLKEVLRLKEHIQLTKNRTKGNINKHLYDSRLNDEARANLLEWYENDIEFYNFLEKTAKQIRSRH